MFEKVINVSKLKGEGLRKRVSPPTTMGSLFDVAAVSFLLTKEWSKFASDVEARNLIGVIMRWVHDIDTLQDVEGEMSRVSKKKNKITNKYVINQKHS